MRFRLSAALGVWLLLAPLAGAQASKAVTIRWYGQSFFQIESSAKTAIVLDPHAIVEFGRQVVRADLVLLTHLHTDHAQIEVLENASKAKVIIGLKGKGRNPTWNLLDEKFKDVRILSTGVYHDKTDGMQRGRCVAFIIEVDGLRICHLGDLGHLLTPEQIKSIGPVDILMIPVGGIYTINGSDAREVVAQLKPRLYVLPMHYGTRVYEDVLPVDEFIEGQQKVDRRTNTNELIVPVDLKADTPTTVILGWKK